MFNTFLVEPLYNFLIFLINVLPFNSLALAIVILTILVRSLLFPISRNAIKSQIKMRDIQPEIKEIQEKYKEDRQTAALEMMRVYRENNIKPFSSILLILIQLPIIFALYFVFLREGLPDINPDLLYSFIVTPESISTTLWFIDITAKSITLAFLAAFSQFIQAKLLLSKNNALQNNNSEKTDREKMMEDVMRGMQVQMKYVMPIFMYFIAYSLGAVIALYFVTSNVFSIFQELYIRKTLIDKNRS